jgi:hypothetical protein
MRFARLLRAARRGTGLALGAGLATAALKPGLSLAAERQFPTIVAFGAAQHIATSEGLYTPVVVVDHESPGWYGDGRLNAGVRTSEFTFGMTHSVLPWLELGYSARARATTEGNGRDLYRRGNRDSAHAFLGDSEAAIIGARLFPKRPWRLEFEAEYLIAQFQDDPDTRPGYDLPSDFQQTEFRLSGTRARLFREEDAKITLTWVSGERSHWRDWELDPDADATRTYTKAMLRGDQPIPWNESDRSRLEIDLLNGEDLDLFSGYPVGGLGGKYSVGGYFRNEFRASRAGVLNLSHEHRHQEDRRVFLYLDAARLEETGLILPGHDPQWRTLASAGIGFYYGIRALMGLPVIVRYAQALAVPEESKESHRIEVMLVVAAGF